MTRIAWQINRAKLGARKLVGSMIDTLVALAKLLRSPPPELDESHAAVRYLMAQMTREEWEAYELMMFDVACTMRCFTPEERVAYNSGLSKLFRKTGRKL